MPKKSLMSCALMTTSPADSVAPWSVMGVCTALADCRAERFSSWPIADIGRKPETSAPDDCALVRPMLWSCVLSSWQVVLVMAWMRTSPEAVTMRSLWLKKASS